MGENDDCLTGCAVAVPPGKQKGVMLYSVIKGKDKYVCLVYKSAETPLGSLPVDRDY